MVPSLIMQGKPRWCHRSSTTSNSCLCLLIQKVPLLVRCTSVDDLCRYRLTSKLRRPTPRKANLVSHVARARPIRANQPPLSPITLTPRSANGCIFALVAFVLPTFPQPRGGSSLLQLCLLPVDCSVCFRYLQGTATSP
jgi:hypothetical protein